MLTPVAESVPCAVAVIVASGVMTPSTVTVTASFGAKLPPESWITPPRLVAAGVTAKVAATAARVNVAVAVRLLTAPVAVNVCVPRVAA